LLLAVLPGIVDLVKLSDLNYESVKKGFNQLEKELGPIDITWTFEKVNEPYKSESYYYVLEEAANKFVKYIGLQPKNDLANQLLNFPKAVTKVIADVTHQTLVGTKEDLLSLYCRLFETYFNILIGQISYALNHKNVKKGKYYQVEDVKRYLLRKYEYKALYQLLEPVNTNLRNAVTHLNYYINNKEKRLYYYYTVDKERKVESIEMDILEKNVKNLIVGNFMLILLLGEKLQQKVSNEVVVKIKEMLKL